MADLKMYADHFLKELINEAVLGVAYEVHRSLTRGTLFLDENASSEEEEKYKIVVENGLDIFGQPIGGSKKNVECPCPNCHRHMAAIRFAPHLEKCMGMGRNSSRIASQRIANSGKFASSVNEALGVDDDLDDVNDINDADWMAACDTSSKKAKKRKAERNNGSSRTSKLSSKVKNSPKVSSTQSSQSDISVKSDSSGLGLGGTMQSGKASDPHTADVNATRNENISRAVATWEEHINATLSGQNKNLLSNSPSNSASGSGVAVKKSKKSSKQPHTKKSKKRQIGTQQLSV